MCTWRLCSLERAGPSCPRRMASILSAHSVLPPCLLHVLNTDSASEGVTGSHASSRGPEVQWPQKSSGRSGSMVFGAVSWDRASDRVSLSFAQAPKKPPGRPCPGGEASDLSPPGCFPKFEGLMSHSFRPSFLSKPDRCFPWGSEGLSEKDSDPWNVSPKN